MKTLEIADEEFESLVVGGLPSSATRRQHDDEDEGDDNSSNPVKTVVSCSLGWWLVLAVGIGALLLATSVWTHNNSPFKTTTTPSDAVDDDPLPWNPDLQPPPPSSNNTATTTTPPSSSPADHVDDRPGYRRPARQYSNAYVPRGQPLTETERQALSETWGSWQLSDDGRQQQRPTDDFFDAYPNRDIPWDKFPTNAWQVDQVYLQSFLASGIQLVERAQKAILAEYGLLSPPTTTSNHQQTDTDDWTNISMPFRIRLRHFNASDEAPDQFGGGWLSQRAYESLTRRLLHAVVTQDSFVFAMGGHSAAAGHGNHFVQSYTMQVQKTLEPVLARLGVYHESRNFGMGGLGTLQNAMAMGDIYGHDIDMLLWDSGMTEKGADQQDLFFRQALLSMDRTPILLADVFDKAWYLHEQVDADIGHLWTSESQFPTTTDVEQASTLPFAIQYLHCSNDVRDVCNAQKFWATCWIERDDVTPPVRQVSKPGGQASWHPGFRYHQLQGRLIGFTVLRALRDALLMWQNADNYRLADEQWHVTDYYQHIRSKVLVRDENAECLKLAIPNAFCYHAAKGRTEMLPRHNPRWTSIRSIIKHDEYFPEPPPNLYDPPDTRMPNLEVPKGAVDYVNIVENGVDFVSSPARKRAVADRLVHRKLSNQPYIRVSNLTYGIGWSLLTKSAADNCDGTYDSFCGRSKGDNCLLYGHNDDRGGIFMDSLSGWIVMNLENVEQGVIAVKFETWHLTNENPRTDGWTCINNHCGDRHLVAYESERPPIHPGSTVHRDLKKQSPPAICDDFKLEFAIDGEITSWDRAKFLERKSNPERVVEIVTLVDNPEFSINGPRDVELAIRIIGCQRINTFLFSHVYWI